jgi:type 1 fimbria pilin
MASPPFCRVVAMACLLVAAPVWATDFNLTGEVMIGTCDWSLGSADRLVALDPVTASQLPASGGSHYVSFELNLHGCAPAVRQATFGFSGSPDPDEPTHFRNTGDAAGVAVVLASDDDRVIAADGSDSERAVAVTGQAVRLRLRAGYWRLAGQTPRVGSVAATATVTLRYD